MKQNFWNIRIPTLLGLFVLFLGVSLTTFLVNKQTILQTNASSLEQPQNVRITNVTDTSFFVTYSTVDKVSGTLNYGKSNSLGQSIFDERSQGKLSNYHVHSFAVNNLTPLTKYYFTIISGQNTYYNNNKPFEVTTGPLINNPTKNSDVIKGKIILPNNAPPSEAIIYITSDGSQVFSTLAKSDGTYSMPLNQIRTADFSSYYDLNQDSIIKMLIYGDLLTSSVTFSKTQINSVPSITLSKNYNLLTQNSSNLNPSLDSQGFPSLVSSTSGTPQKIQILTPKKDQGLTDSQPLFKGTAKPGENVQIVIHSSQAIQTQVTTDKNGNWSYTPQEPLTPGTHTITITTKDISGILKTITQSFVVYASGTQIQNANGSPTPTPTPTLIAKTTSPTPTPVIILTPTPDIVITSTPFPTPTEILVQAPVSTTSGILLPPTGNPSIIVFGAFGIAVSLIGGFFFLLSHKNKFKL